MRLWICVLMAMVLAGGAFITGYNWKKPITYDSVRNIDLSIGLPDNYTSQSTDRPTELSLEQQIEKLKHSIWHLQQKQDQYYEAWQCCLQELTDSGLYELDIEVSSESENISVVLRSYKKAPLINGGVE